MSPKPRNVRLQATTKYGFWIRTKLDPIRAVKWAPETLPDGRTRVNGRCWQEVLPATAPTREPVHFLGDEVTPAPPTEPMPYAPAPGEPVCGWQLEGSSGEAQRYCPRSVVPGELCAPHAAAYAAIQQGEEAS